MSAIKKPRPSTAALPTRRSLPQPMASIEAAARAILDTTHETFVSGRLLAELMPVVHSPAQEKTIDEMVRQAERTAMSLDESVRTIRDLADLAAGLRGRG